MKLMIKNILFAVFLLTYANLYAQERSITFENGDFQEAMEKARQQKKLLFVDCYTSWCGPCKMLSSRIFTDNAVADYFNSRFVSFKIDCEKGEGPELARRFKISGYPTMLFLDSDGKVRARLMGGSQHPEQFLNRIKEAFNPKTSLAGKENTYRNGCREKAFLLDLISEYKKINERTKAKEVSLELLSTLSEKELLTNEMWEVIRYYYVSTYSSKWWDFILEHRKVYESLVGRKAVADKIGQTMHPYLFGFATGRKQMKDMEEYNSYRNLVEDLRSTRQPVLKLLLELGKSASFGNLDDYLRTLEGILPQMDRSEQYRILTNMLRITGLKLDKGQKKVMKKLIDRSYSIQNERYRESYGRIYEMLDD